MKPLPLTPRRAALALLLAGLTGPALADRDARTPLLPAYVSECGSCHVAFPPSLLAAGSWQRLMGGLARHFGTDASASPGKTREITDWLTAHAGSGKRVVASPPEDRLTRSPWFTREHRKVSVATWAMDAVGTTSNCAACHPRAEQGDFNEHDLRIPR